MDKKDKQQETRTDEPTLDEPGSTDGPRVDQSKISMQMQSETSTRRLDESLSEISQSSALAESNDKSEGPTEDPFIGKIISERWKILERLGVGGMSVVYKAKHLVMDRLVAVKVLAPQLLTNTVSVARFEQEAKAAGCLNHPNIIAVQDVLRTPDGYACLIMDYVSGRSLAEEITKNGKLSIERALAIFIQLADAFIEAHEKGVIHRDLKPSNVMLVDGHDERDLIKIVDFGIAKLVSKDGTQQQGLTKTGDVFGSPLYMSPEQCLGKESDARSDIYSMGCLMYESLAGKPPLAGDNALETIHKHINEDPPSLVNGPTMKSMQRLDAVIRRAMAKEPSRRYQSMSDLKKDLEIVTESSETGWLYNARALRGGSVKKARKINRALMATVGVLLVVMGLLVWHVVAPMVFVDSAELDNSSLWKPAVEAQAAKTPDDYSDREHELLIHEHLAKQRGDPVLAGDCMVELGRFYSHYGQNDLAIRSLREALVQYGKSLPREALPIGEAQAMLAYSLYMNGLLPEARDSASRAVRILSKFDEKETTRKMLNSGLILAEIDLIQRSYSRDLPDLRAVDMRFHTDSGEARTPYAIFCSRFADILRDCDYFRDAEQHYKQSAQIWQQEGDIHKNDLARCFYGGALCNARQGKRDVAEKLFATALDLAKSAPSKRPELIRMIKRDYAQVIEQRDWWQALPLRFTS